MQVVGEKPGYPHRHGVRPDLSHQAVRADSYELPVSPEEPVNNVRSEDAVLRRSVSFWYTRISPPDKFAFWRRIE